MNLVCGVQPLTYLGQGFLKDRVILGLAQNFLDQRVGHGGILRGQHFPGVHSSLFRDCF